MSEHKRVVCKFKFLCDKTWDELQEIEGEEQLRFCNGCLQPVFYTSTYDELVVNVSEGRCVAIAHDSDIDIDGAKDITLLGHVMLENPI